VFLPPLEQWIFEPVLLVFLAHFVEIVHVELRGGLCTWRTKEE
jgi:hypothetical protein